MLRWVKNWPTGWFPIVSSTLEINEDNDDVSWICICCPSIAIPLSREDEDLKIWGLYRVEHPEWPGDDNSAYLRLWRDEGCLSLILGGPRRSFSHLNMAVYIYSTALIVCTKLSLLALHILLSLERLLWGFCYSTDLWLRLKLLRLAEPKPALSAFRARYYAHRCWRWVSNIVSS